MSAIVSFILWPLFLIFLGFVLFYLLWLAPSKEEKEREKRSQENSHSFIYQLPSDQFESYPAPETPPIIFDEAAATMLALKEQAYQQVPDEYKPYIKQIDISGEKAAVSFEFNNVDESTIVEAAESLSRRSGIELRKLEVDNQTRYDKDDKSSIHPRMAQRYKEILKKYEEWYLEELSFEKRIIDERRVLYVIEDCLVELFTLSRKNSGLPQSLPPDMYPYYRLTLEELTYNSFYDLYATSFHSRTGTWSFLDYRPFFDKENSKEESIALVEKRFPELEIRKRINDWEGLPFDFCVFETADEEGNIGRAVFHSESRLIPVEIHSIASEMQDRLVDEYVSVVDGKIGLGACIRAAAQNAGVSPKKDWLISSRRKTREYEKREVSFDDNFKRIVFERIAVLRDASEVDYRNDKPIVFDGRVSYFTFERKIKDPYSENLSVKMLEEISQGSFSDIERIEYAPITGKWKNEELMFRCVQNVFHGERVLYQHSPEWLGQQTYDVFVPNRKIAFEYQGKQHFEPVDFFGGEENYKNQVKRDRRKKKLSKDNGITLIYVNHWEDVSEDLIRKKVKKVEQVIPSEDGKA